MTTKDPACGWCTATITTDIRPAESMFLCPPHQRILDRMGGYLDSILVPLDQLQLPDDRWPTGIITTASYPQPETEPFTFEKMQEAVRLMMSDPDYPSLEHAVLAELNRAILPTSPVELAIRIGAIARAYMRHDLTPTKTYDTYRIRWLTTTGHVLHQETGVRPSEAEKYRPFWLTHDVAGHDIQQRRTEEYRDGSQWSGPWITVTSTLEPTTEETPCPPSTTSPG